jgi:hypothetical protein
MPTATLGITEAFPPVLDAIGFLSNAAAVFSVDGLPEHLIMPPKPADVVRRLNEESEQV